MGFAGSDSRVGRFNGDAMKNKNRLVSIMVLGRRWFQKTYGNTYNSVSIILTHADGVISGTELETDYGYGSMYMQRAAQWLNDNGYTPGNESRSFLSTWCREHNVNLIDRVQDVPRKKDLEV